MLILVQIFIKQLENDIKKHHNIRKSKIHVVMFFTGWLNYWLRAGKVTRAMGGYQPVFNL